MCARRSKRLDFSAHICYNNEDLWSDRLYSSGVLRNAWMCGTKNGEEDFNAYD